LFNNPKNIFLNYINKEFKEIGNIYNKVSDNEIRELAKTNSVSVDTNVSFNIDINNNYSTPELDGLMNEISKLNLATTNTYDNKNKELLYNVNFKYDEDSLFNILLYGQDKNLYTKLNEVLDYYIKIEVEDYDQLFNDDKNIELSEKVVDRIKNVLLSNISKKDFETSKTKLLIDTKIVNVKQIKYILNELNIKLLIKNTLMDLKNDQEFINSSATLLNENEEYIKNWLSETADNIKIDEITSNDTLELSLYTKGLTNEVIGTSIVYNTNNEKIILETVDYKENKTFKMIKDDETLFNGYFEEKEGKKIITINFGAMTLIIRQEDESKYSFKLIDEGDVQLKGIITNDKKVITKGKEYKNEFIIKTDIIVDNESIINMEFKNLSNTKIGEKIEMPSFENAKKIEDLKQEDFNEITSKLSTTESINTFIQNINKYVY